MKSHTTINIPVLPDEIIDTLPESIRIYIRYLKSRIQKLETQVHELEAKLFKDSSNSSKPPSSDGLKRKTKSLREQSDKKQGGQHGHVGKGLAQVNNPDTIIVYTPDSCDGCNFSLNNVQGNSVEHRQVFDIIQPKITVTEHRVEEKKCPCCGKIIRASFPENIKGPVQYGDRVRALIAYFSHEHFIPVDRICEVFKDIFGISLSPGTCANVDERLFANLEVFEAGLKTYLLATHVLHFDETGMRCEKKLHRVHVASSQMASLYTIHAKRGREAMDEACILPKFQGMAIHDHWFPYFTYQQLRHGLCNAHHLRELVFVHEQEKEAWAKRMYDLLIRAKADVEKCIEQGALSPEVLLQIEQDYQQILTEGFAYHASLPSLPVSKRGKQKQRDGKNILDRLNEKRDRVLRFIYDFSVPFTNNQGERDIRMVKLRQKIGGCFPEFDTKKTHMTANKRVA
jgi:transposase